MKNFRAAERCAEQAGDLEQRALSLNEIGNVLASRSDLDGALQYKRQALELATKLGDPYVISPVCTISDWYSRKRSSTRRRFSVSRKLWSWIGEVTNRARSRFR